MRDGVCSENIFEKESTMDEFGTVSGGSADQTVVGVSNGWWCCCCDETADCATADCPTADYNASNGSSNGSSNHSQHKNISLEYQYSERDDEICASSDEVLAFEHNLIE